MKAVLVFLFGACMVGLSLSESCVYPLLEVAFDENASQQMSDLTIMQGTSLVLGGGVNVTCLDAFTGASLACLGKERCVDFMVKYCRRLQLTTELDGTKSLACDNRYRLSADAAVTDMQ